jgi:hypothetical protein
MALPASVSKYVVLAAGGVEYKGPTSLVQFNVEDIRMVSKNSEYLTVKITLKRMFQYHLAATFLPTILLMIITEIALFVDENHFDVLVMIHLTTMLVMYTLYQGLQDIMPNVAYLKFIDIFLLFGVIVPFITFIIQVASKLLAGMEKTSEEEDEDDKPQKEVSSTELEMELAKKIEPPKRENIRRVLKYTAERVIPILTAFFLSGYSIFAVYLYTKD